MSEIKVTDYSIFNNATSTTNALIEKIKATQTVLENAITTLSNSSIFMGEISEECVNNLKETIKKLSSMNSNFNSIIKSFNETYNAYKKGDKNSADKIINDGDGDNKDSSKSNSSTDQKNKTTVNAGTSKDADAMIDRAMGVIGSPWVTSGYYWSGDPETSYFTCSGLIDYALGRPEHSSSPESLRDEIGMENLTTDVSQLKKGDLVFYRYDPGHPDGWGHVGIYLGDNQIIDSSTGGVQIRDVNYMELLGGGTLV